MPRLERYSRSVELPVAPAIVWAFHTRPDALALLQPPSEPIEVIASPASLEVGTRVVFRARVGPLRIPIELERIACEEGRAFTERMVRGPYATWVHARQIDAIAGGARLTDTLTYALPLGPIGRVLGGRAIRRHLERTFAHRHAVTRRECVAMAEHL